MLIRGRDYQSNAKIQHKDLEEARRALATSKQSNQALSKDKLGLQETLQIAIADTGECVRLRSRSKYRSRFRPGLGLSLKPYNLKTFNISILVQCVLFHVE